MTTRSYRRGAAAAVAQREEAHLILAIEGGRPTAGSSRHRVEGVGEVRIGRGATRSARRAVERGVERLVITVPDPHMSSSHARLIREDARCEIEDLGSKNGVFINGARKARCVLADGDLVRLGETVFLFREALATPPGSACDVDAPALESSLATLVPSLARDLDLLTRVAVGAIPIVLLGETGTGKEVIARAVHALSRRSGAFVAVNCGALPANLVESELFGHKRGAFSGALADHPGLFRAAHGGTLLLDEIGDLPASAQTALLRVLQEGEVRPVGGTHATKVDVRVLAATHRDLEAQVARGAFREDLLARINGFTLRLPPLRERREDIGLLTGALLRRVNRPHLTLSAACCEALLAYDWPRNVRELERTLSRAALLAGSGVIEAEHLGIDATIAPRDLSRDGVLASLERHAGNVSAVAKELKTSRSQVHRWLRRFGLEPSEYRP